VFDFRFDLCRRETVAPPSFNKSLPHDVLGGIDCNSDVEHGVQSGLRTLVQQQVVAFNDKRANGTRYQSRARARLIEITIENRDGDLILLIVP